MKNIEVQKEAWFKDESQQMYFRCFSWSILGFLDT
jgi:hypothetical protein